MKSENNEHDLNSIAESLRRQNAVLEVLVHHLASIEATGFVRMDEMLPDEALHTAKEVRDHILSEIHERIIAEAERDAEDS